MATQAYSSWSVKCSGEMVHNWNSNDDHWGRAFWDTHQNEQTNGLTEPSHPTSVHTPAGVLIQYRYDRDFPRLNGRSGHEFSVLSIIHRPK